MASNIIKVAPMLLLGIVIICTYTFASASCEEGLRNPNNVVVKGSVLCDSQLSETDCLLPGVLVAVECSIINNNRKWKNSNSMVYVEGKTYENGEFKVELPNIQNLNPEKSCSVRFLSSPHEFCDIPSITMSSQLALTSSNTNGIHIYEFTPLFYRSSKQEGIFSSLPRRRALQFGIPPLPKLSFPPLPTIPSLPKSSLPPLPSIPPLPKLSVPLLPYAPPLNIPNLLAPPLPSAPALPKLSVPPLSSVPTLPKLTVPPLPSAPPLPKFSVPPLPNVPSLPNLGIPPLNIPSIPPFPKLNFPPLPNLPSSFPPFPLFTPPPPSTKDETP